jgi:hypothetical protein
MALTLAEQLLLLSYGEKSGKPVIPATHLDYGLAGAELLDLVYAGKAGLYGGKIGTTPLGSSPPITSAGGQPIYGPPPAITRVHDAIVARIAAKPGHSAEWWVYHLAGSQRRKDLLDKLAADGVLAHHPHRLRHDTYPEADPAQEAELESHLRDVIKGEAEPDQRSVALIGLAHACGLDRRLFPDHEPRDLRRRIAELTEGDWCGHAVQRIIETMNVAVLSAVTGGLVSSTATTVPST